MTLMEWVYANLAEASETTEGKWATLFALVIWWAWKWRCGDVFGEQRRWRDRVQFLKESWRDVTSANSKEENRRGQDRRVEMMVGWKPPDSGWFKLNTDGASRGNPELAAAGGVLRNSSGEWCGGFAAKIGRCSAPLAELWGVYHGLYVAWEQRVTRLELEVDSKMVVEFLTTRIGDTHPLSFLVRLCHGFLSKDWVVRITHVYMEVNRLADGLSNYAFSLPFGVHMLSLVPSDVSVLLREDMSGASWPRQVAM